MKRVFLLLFVLTFSAFACLVSCDKDSKIDFEFTDISMLPGDEVDILSVANVSASVTDITYTFEGDAISVDGNKIKALVGGTETMVTAKSGENSASFKVTVADVGTLSLGNLSVTRGNSRKLNPEFSKEEYKSDVTYTFDGENIEIKNGRITGLVKDTVTVVTATTKYHTATFSVMVVPNALDYGEIEISAPSMIYTNYPAVDITATFTNPEYATDITFTTSSDKVFVSDGKLYAKGDFPEDTKVRITAMTEYHSSYIEVTVSTFRGPVNTCEMKAQYYEANVIKPENKGKLIFIGDSYFDGQLNSQTGNPPFWSDFYTDDYTDGSAFLMGISSSGIADWEVVSERIVYPMEPAEIAVHIGFNDVHSRGISANEITRRVMALLEQYHERLPDAKIYFFGIEPKKNAQTAGSQYANSSLVVAPQANAIFESYADEYDWLWYVDSPSFCYNANGTINQNFYLTTDLSHPTLASYELFEAAIKKIRDEQTATEA